MVAGARAAGVPGEWGAGTGWAGAGVGQGGDRAGGDKIARPMEQTRKWALFGVLGAGSTADGCLPCAGPCPRSSGDRAEVS
jgi:hypothetical protein